MQDEIHVIRIPARASRPSTRRVPIVRVVRYCSCVLGPPSDFWGKLEAGEPFRWHPLIDHCADVAACVESLLRGTLLGPRLARLGGLRDLAEVQIQRLCVLAALHDLGKFSLGFQNKALPHPPFLSGHTNDFLAALSNNDFLRRFRVSIEAERIEEWGESISDLLDASLCFPRTRGDGPVA